jgi:hypothetical protein
MINKRGKPLNMIVFLVDTEYKRADAYGSKNPGASNSSKTTARFYSEAT